MNLDVLVFSKDRPLQLDGYIHSLNWYGNENGNINITVLAKISPEYREAYELIKKSYNNVTFIEETSFARQVKEWVNNASPMIMFGCDDVVFIDFFNPELAEKALSTISPVIDFVSLRLDNTITYCQPSDKHMTPPELIKLNVPMNTFNWKACPMNWDWGYPFEVAGTIYRRDNVKHLLSMFQDNYINHPNRIEGPLCYYARSIWNGLGACFNTAKMKTVTVNRVQDLEKNRLCVDKELSPKELLDLFNQGKRIDFAAYNYKKYNSICIGDLFLC